MPSDSERREVAERLRRCARETNGTRDFAMYLSYWVGVVGPTLDEGNPFTVAADRRLAERTLEKLADLIDRPTCRLDLTDVETHGNVKVRIYECSRCGRSCEEIYGKYERCPHCGGVVVEAILIVAILRWVRP